MAPKKNTGLTLSQDKLSDGTIVHVVLDGDTVKFVTLYATKAQKRLDNMLAARVLETAAA